MKTFSSIVKPIKAVMVLGVILITYSQKSLAQAAGKGTGDTVTYVLYKDTVSFVSQKTVVYTDKHSVDSLANALAAGSSPGSRIVYEKYGQKPKVIKIKDLKVLDRSGFFRITVAYSKETPTADARPLYLISGR